MIKERSFVMYLLLSIITCGIYSIYFWYVYSRDMNVLCDGDGKTTTNYIVAILLSVITCGIYMLFWHYGIGNRLQENAPRYKLNFSESGTTVLLWLIVGSLICGIGSLYAFYILIKNINQLGLAYNKMVVDSVARN